MKKLLQIALIALTAISMTVALTSCKKEEPTTPQLPKVSTAPKVPETPKVPKPPKMPETPKVPEAPKDHPAH